MDYYKEALVKSDEPSTQRPCLAIGDLSIFYQANDAGYPWKAVGLMTYSDEKMMNAVDFDFWIDIDADNKGKQTTLRNVEASLSNCKALLEYLSAKLSIDPLDIDVYFSGHGGFHLLLPFKLESIRSVDRLLENVKQTIRAFQQDLAPVWCDGSHIDQGIYNKKGLIRLPWSKHDSALRKVPLSPGDLKMSAPELVALVEAKSDTFPGSYDFQWHKEKKNCTALVELVRRPPRPTHRSTALSGCTSGLLDRVLDDVADETPCVEEIGKFRLPLHSGAKFNLPKMFLLSHLKRLGYPLDIATEIVTAWADRYSLRSRSPANKARQRRIEVESAARTIFRSPPGSNYDFSVNGNCVRCLSNMMHKSAVRPCDSRLCRHNCTGPWREPTRIRLSTLRSKCGNPNNFWVYTTIALNDQIVSLDDLTKELKMSRNTIRATIGNLQRLGLVVEEKSGKSKVIRATRSIKKSMLLKN
ncbi:HTH domain-containing protein [bacterium]|nr:HTH domain-containing protein [bacterium]